MEIEVQASQPGCLLRPQETELLERAKRDREAFGALYRQHCASIANYVFRRIGDTPATEDRVADVFLIAMRYLPRFNHRGVPVRAWLYRIASNVANRWIRRERRRGWIAASRPGLAGRPAGDEPAGGADARVVAARQALLAFKPKYQTVLTLDYLKGMSIAEIALIVGCRVGTVKSRLSRGRDALCRRLGSGSVPT